jgi:[ribosomal protein S5]-alanine N-acetyltransferase
MEWQPPLLQTPRLLLRAVTEDERDVLSIYEYASNPAVANYTLWDPHQSLDDTRAFIRAVAITNYRNRVPEPLGICLRDAPNQLIGTVGCFWASADNNCMELGYALGQAHWGQGIMVEAATRTLDYVFTEYKPQRIQARCKAVNRASIRVLEKLGMTFEGSLRSSLFHRGRFWDLAYFSVLRGEWEHR